MNSYMPRFHDYPISTFGAHAIRRNTHREITIRQAAERWTMRSRPRG